eukprot:376382-Prymnesium_polylepis.4
MHVSPTTKRQLARSTAAQPSVRDRSALAARVVCATHYGRCSSWPSTTGYSCSETVDERES